MKNFEPDTLHAVGEAPRGMKPLCYLAIRGKKEL